MNWELSTRHEIPVMNRSSSIRESQPASKERGNKLSGRRSRNGTRSRDE